MICFLHALYISAKWMCQAKFILFFFFICNRLILIAVHAAMQNGEAKLKTKSGVLIVDRSIANLKMWVIYVILLYIWMAIRYFFLLFFIYYYYLPLCVRRNRPVSTERACIQRSTNEKRNKKKENLTLVRLLKIHLYFISSSRIGILIVVDRYKWIWLIYTFRRRQDLALLNYTFQESVRTEKTKQMAKNVIYNWLWLLSLCVIYSVIVYSPSLTHSASKRDK